jgi:2-polyprenyl-3-methyl-5-hydroxy-6-metoxy-1,4-benzoquinol methylase
MFHLSKKIISHIKYKVMPPYNMYKNSGEQFYFRQYAQHILPYFQAEKSLLDIGCQYGRFSIPAAQSDMRVTASDIRRIFFSSIQKKCNNTKYPIQFRKETIDETIKHLSNEEFDIILCIELLYNLPNFSEIITQLSSLLALNGKLITSHRTKAYYIYRFIKEKRWGEIESLLANKHPRYNAQSTQELFDLYTNSNLKIIKMFPVGMFSGMGNDAFSYHANPLKMNDKEKEILFQYETSSELISSYIENARYIGIISEKSP